MIWASATFPGGRDRGNELAKTRLLSLPHEPLFIADWERVLMIHFEVDPAALQSVVPFELDLRDGRAYVSVVAFAMRGMRPRFGRVAAAWLLKPIATHNFLNVRTYVRRENEHGIYFMTEWLSNRLSVVLGPPIFGLPYRYGKINYDHGSAGDQKLSGRVEGYPGFGALSYAAALEKSAVFGRCEAGTLDEWLMERYTAFTSLKAQVRFFRVWHEPWMQKTAGVHLHDLSLLTARWPFLAEAPIAGANYSPGAFNVWMGWPHRLRAKERVTNPCPNLAEMAF